jgi:hypothetical protein
VILTSLLSSSTYLSSLVSRLPYPEFICSIVLPLIAIDMKAEFAVLLAVAAAAIAQTATTSEPALAQIQAAAATTKPEVTTSNVKGLAFDRFYQVWLENIVRDELERAMTQGN